MASLIYTDEISWIVTEPISIEDEKLNDYLVFIVQNSQHNVDLISKGIKWSWFNAHAFYEDAEQGTSVMAICADGLADAKKEKIIYQVSLAEKAYLDS